MVTCGLGRSKDERCYQNELPRTGSQASKLLAALSWKGFYGGCRKEDQTQALGAFGLRAHNVDSKRKVEEGKEPGQRTSAYLPPTSAALHVSTFHTPVSDPCNFQRLVGVYYFISFQKLPHTIRAPISTSFSCLKSSLWGSRITVSCQVRKKERHTPHHSYHQSDFQEGLAPNCQEIASLGCHGGKPLTESQACVVCSGGWRRRGGY